MAEDPINTKILSLVLQSVREVGENQGSDFLINADETTALLGMLDSIGTVYLITILEETLADELGMQITLADEHAMNLENSPFLTIATLVRHVETLVAKSKGAGH